MQSDCVTKWLERHHKTLTEEWFLQKDKEFLVMETNPDEDSEHYSNNNIGFRIFINTADNVWGKGDMELGMEQAQSKSVVVQTPEI